MLLLLFFLVSYHWRGMLSIVRMRGAKGGRPRRLVVESMTAVIMRVEGWEGIHEEERRRAVFTGTLP